LSKPKLTKSCKSEEEEEEEKTTMLKLTGLFMGCVLEKLTPRSFRSAVKLE